MKIKRINRERGGIFLALVVLILAAIIIGGVVYSIYKALSNWKPRPIDPDDVNTSLWINSASNEIYNIVSTNGSLPSTGTLSDGTFVLSVANAGDGLVNVERSTNMIDWETIARVPAQDLSHFTDTNPPYPSGFYRIR